MPHLLLHNRGIHIYQEDKDYSKTSSIPFSVKSSSSAFLPQGL